MHIIIGILAAVLSITALSKPRPKSDPVDSVLDRLEKRLLDEEAEDLTHKDSSFSNSTNRKDYSALKSSPQTPKQSFKKERINSSTKEAKGIQGIGQLVTELEEQIDQFSQSVQKSKQSMIDEAKIENAIEIEARLTDPDSAAISMLSVKLDGFAIYQSQDSAGLWLPSAAIPLYAGPFPPGNHRLDVEIRLAKKSKAPLLIIDDVYHFVNKAFDISVPVSKERKRYIILISPRDGEGHPFEANLEEAA
jgi:hypothetical protein